MPYTLLKTNGQKLTVVQDSTVDTTTDLSFVGKNYTGYGSPVNENFLKLLENFSNDIQPNKPITGQIWFDSANKKLKVYDGKIFKSLGFVYTGSTAPTTPTQGDFWLNSSLKLKIFDTSSGWIDVNTPVNANYGKGSTNALAAVTIKDSNNQDKVIVPITVLGSTATIVSTSSMFAVSPTEYISNKFPKVYPGLTLPSTNEDGISVYYSNPTYAGNMVWGTAASSLGLVKISNTGTSLLKVEDFVLRSDLSNGLSSLLVTDNEGITVGSQKVLKIHIAPASVANISLINGNSLKFNLNTVNGTYTNILSFDGTSGLKILPNASIPVSLGDNSSRFGNLFVTTVVATTVSASTIVAPTVSATTISATTITGTIISGSQLYDNGSRVLTQATIPAGGVGTIAGTANQVLVNGSTNAATGSIVLSLPGIVNINALAATSVSANNGTISSLNATTLTATIIQGTAAIYGAAIYDSGSRVLTNANAVSSIYGTAKQVLVNGGVGPSSGTVLLSLPQNIDSTATPTFAGINAGTGTVTAGLVNLGSGALVAGNISISALDAKSGSASMTGNWTLSGNLTLTAGNISAQSGTVITKTLSAYQGSATIVGNWSLNGGTLQATYADLAERYHADQVYESGTVLVVGGAVEVTTTSKYADTAVAGIVSTNPAYTLNAGAGSNDTHPYIALKGRVPCKVRGYISKGDLLVTSATPGYAEKANGSEHHSAVLARALQDFDGEFVVIEVMVV